MADDTAATTASDAAQRAGEQARARKERREAKIRAGGSARLSKITGMGGRGASLGASAAEAAEDAAEQHAPVPDPDVVDISQRSFPPPPTRTRDDRPGAGAGVDDPLAQMMAQVMGGAAGGAAPLPPSLAGLFPPQPPQPQAPPDSHAASFRLAHALLALALGLYVSLLTPFAGTSAQRKRAALDAAARDDADEARRRRVFFWIFATGEALLLTTRFFLDKGRSHSRPGMLWSLAGHLAEPWRGYLTVGLRYAQIFTTVRADMLLCIFVLGVCAWSKS